MDKNIEFNFTKYPFCFRNTKVDRYTNYLENVNELNKLMKEIFEKILPHYIQYTFEDRCNSRHSHKLEGEEYNLAYKIVKNLVKDWNSNIDLDGFLQQNLDGELLWQVGCGGIRIIGIRQSNVLNVLFIDYHHLISPSDYYNGRDYQSFEVSVVK